MAKMPQDVTELFTDPQASKVLATVDPEGTLHAGVRGRFNAVDEETIAFADLAQVKRRPEFKANQKATIVVFKLPSHGYQIQGTFQGYQTSGALFDQWAQMLKERINVELWRVGLIKVNEIYSYTSEDRSEHGTKIA